ncbi:RHS repeat-associated core domain-containing protein [Amycolatopsis sp. cg5]|uniref:RHS repeat-associated core domain-containing protein n=1 Tax=Amycolatopsis sp. cg5 TaxID=3238802 RepID=UPI003525120E
MSLRRRLSGGMNAALVAMLVATVALPGLPSATAQQTPPTTPVQKQLPAAVQAGPASYAYDAAGRLAGVVGAGGEVARYVYDAAGNVTSVDRLGTPAVAVLAAVPSVVRPGDSITIAGKGFAATGTTVRIGRLGVPVTSVTPDRIVVTVPDGTLGGQLQVTTPAGTGTLDGITVVRGDRPEITEFAPKTAAPGSPVTLTVTNPDPQFASNVVRLNGIIAAVTGQGPGTLTVTVPPGAGTGKLELSTPGGVSTAANALIVPPAEVPAGAIDTSGAITAGTRLAVPIAAGKYAIRYFDAADGDRFAATLDGGTFGDCGLDAKIFDEHNRQAATAGCVGSAGWVETTPVSGAGTRVLVLHNTADTAGTINVTLHKVAADLAAGTQPLNGTAKTVTIANPGQNAYTTFTGGLGQRVLIRSSAASPAFGCCDLTWALTGPDGTRIGAAQYGNSTLDTVTLPAAGTYRITVDPAYGLLGSVTLTAWSVPADLDAGTQALNGTAKTITIANPGQNAYTTFAGTTGQRVLLQSTNTSAVFGCCDLTWTLVAPDGTQVGGTQYGNSTIDTIALPQNGNYRVVVNPAYALTGSMTLAAWSVPADLNAGAQPLNGTAKTVTIANPGQNAYTTFAGTTGQRVLVQSTNTSAVFGCCDLTWTLVAPDGTQVGGTQYGDSILESIALPQNGNYKIVVNPAYALTGSVTLTAWNVPADLDAGAQPLNGTAKTVTVTNPGQNAFTTFAGTTGQRVLVQSTNASAVFGCCDLTWTLVAPDGSQVGGTQYGNSTLDTIALPQNGNYKIVVNPAHTLTGSVTLTAWNVPADLDAGALPLTGAAKTVTVTNPGQGAFTGFAGTSGQHLIVQSSATSPVFGCCGLTWTLAAPDGSQVGGTQYGDSTLDVTLPQTGAYKLKVNPDAALTGSITFSATIATTPKAVEAPPRRAAVEKNDPDVPPKVKHEVRPVPPPDARTASQWAPDTGNLRGADWLTRRPDPAKIEDLKADNGITAISGHVRDLDGRPLPGIPVRAGDRKTSTDPQGRFLLTGVPANTTTIIVDGYAAQTAPARYGTFRIHAKVAAGVTTPLEATVWLPRLDMRHVQPISSPTGSEVVLTTPEIPGLEVRLPAGSVVRDLDGNVVRELGITAIPLDRPPYPLPRNGIVPVYFTVQPGGATIFPQGARVVYPNYTKLPAGSFVDFWNYDPQDKGWYVYGHGKVSADAKQVVPDEKTKLWTLDGSMFNTPGNPKHNKNWLEDLIDKISGDPVDLSTGLLTDTHTDLGLKDTLPISLTRTYWQGDGHAREFGLNQSADYNMFLTSELQYQEVDLNLPTGGKVHYVRTSPGTGFSDAVFAATGTAGRYGGSTITQVDGDWVLRLRDGSAYFFPWYSRVRAIQDRNGNQVTFTRIGGNNGEVSQITSPNGRWIAFEYDGANRVTKAKDNIGRSTSYTYDAEGRLATVVDVAGKTSTYTYDTANRVTKLTDARGIAYLTVTYDLNGRVATQALAGGGTYTFAYMLDANGQITETRVTQPNGSVRRVVFDANHIVATDTQAFGTSLARTTSYTRGRDNRIDAVVDPYGRRTTYEYDTENRPTSTVELTGTADQVTLGKTVYGPFDLPVAIKDAAGKTTSYTYDAKGNLLTATDPLGRVSTLAYTVDGQLAKVTAADGAVTTFTYAAGAPTSVKDPLGRVSKMFADAAGRPVSATNPAGATTLTGYDVQDQPVKVTDPLGRSSTFGYDAGGNLTSFTDARGKTTRWGFDDADRPISRTDPLGKTSTITYDNAGRVTATVDRAGVRATGDYDALNRLTKARFGVTGATAQSELTYAYDAVDRPASITDTAGGTTSYTYDARDRTASVTSPNGTVGYGYDVLGRQTSSALPGLPATSYTYDAAGRPSGVSRGADAVTITRDAAGRPTVLNLPGGWTQTSAYDAAGQLTGITYAHGGTTKGSIGYAYDAAGQRTSVTGSLADVTLPAARAGLTYNDANRLTTPGTTYDAEGHLLTDGTTTYTWNARGQLTGTSKAGLAGSYTYDAAGNRSSRTVGGVTTKFLYDGPNVGAELDGAGAVSASLLSGGVDQWFARTKAGVTDTTLTDALGSPVELGRPDGTFAANQAYSPFGTPSADGDRRGSDLSFTGRQDDGTGLLNYRSRYYSPDQQRFISEDSIGITGGANVYGYAANSPTNLTDPSGNNPMVVGCLVGGAVGGGLDYVSQRLSGRKVSWGSVGVSAASGCALGALGGWLSRAGTLARAESMADKMARVRAVGAEGESLAGINPADKVRIPSLNNTADFRVPDALSPTTLTEVKNVAKLSYTAQLQDFVAFAQATGRQFDLIVRQGTQLSGPLQNMVNNGFINLIRSLP